MTSLSLLAGRTVHVLILMLQAPFDTNRFFKYIFIVHATTVLFYKCIFYKTNCEKILSILDGGHYSRLENPFLIGSIFLGRGKIAILKPLHSDGFSHTC